MTKDLTEVEIEAVARAIHRQFLATLGGIKDVDAEIEEGWADWVPEATAAIAAHKAHLSASGYVIVPREPTEAMIFDGVQADIHAFGFAGGTDTAAIYKAMLSALPDKDG